MFRSLQKVFKRTKSNGASRQARRFRPTVEALEDRTAMSVYNPAAVSHGDQLHVLQTDHVGRLVDHYWDGSWHWQNLGTPSSLPWDEDLRKPAPIVHGGRFHVLVTGTNGHLYDYSWNTSSSPASGLWEDRSMDSGHPNCDFIGTPAPINYGGVLHVFVSGDNGCLYDDIYNRFVYSGIYWQWVNIGYCGASGSPAAISYNNALHVYVTGGGLYDCWTSDRFALPGAVWRRDYHGNGGTSFAGRTPSAITYYNRLHVFVTGHDGNLYDHWWDGGSWHWDNHHNGGANVSGTPATIVYGGSLHVFVTGWDGNLYDHYWNGSWHWDNHGHGNGTYRTWGDPSVVNHNGNLHVYVSVEWFYWDNYGRSHYFNDLWDHYWNGSWHWDNHGDG